MNLYPELSTVTTATTTTTDDGATTRRTEPSDESETSDVRPDSLASDSDPAPRAARNLYVRNMPPGFTADQMTKLFSRFGDVVSTKMIVDIKKGTPLGFGFVMFSKARDAEAAMAALHEAEVDGYHITVRAAEPGTREPGEPSERVLLRKLPPATTERIVQEHSSHLLTQPHSAIIAGVRVFEDADGYKTAWLHCTSAEVAHRLAAALNNSVAFPGRQDLPRSRRRTIFAKVLSRGETFTPPAPALVRFPLRPPFDPTTTTTTTETTSSVHPRTQPSSVHLHHHSTSAHLHLANSPHISPFAHVPSHAAVTIAPPPSPISPMATTAATATTTPHPLTTNDFNVHHAGQATSFYPSLEQGRHAPWPPALYPHQASYQHQYSQYFATHYAPSSAPVPTQPQHFASNIALATGIHTAATTNQQQFVAPSATPPVILLQAHSAPTFAAYAPTLFTQTTHHHQQQQQHNPAPAMPISGMFFTLAEPPGVYVADSLPVAVPLAGPAPLPPGVFYAYPPYPHNTSAFR
jgi:hypothetical protein